MFRWGGVTRWRGLPQVRVPAEGEEHGAVQCNTRERHRYHKECERAAVEPGRRHVWQGTNPCRNLKFDPGFYPSPPPINLGRTPGGSATMYRKGPASCLVDPANVEFCQICATLGVSVCFLGSDPTTRTPKLAIVLFTGTDVSRFAPGNEGLPVSSMRSICSWKTK